MRAPTVELSARAEAVAEQGHELAQDYTNLTAYKSHHTILEGVYDLQLMTTLEHVPSEGDPVERARFVFLNAAQGSVFAEDRPDPLLFSIGLHDLWPDAPRKGPLVKDWRTNLSSALEKAGDNPVMADFLGGLIKIMPLVEVGYRPPQETVEGLNLIYLDLIAQGIAQGTKDRYEDLTVAGSAIHIRERFAYGSLDDGDEYKLRQPGLEITLEDDSDKALVFLEDQDPRIGLETIIQPADFATAHARYAKPEDVRRDQKGHITFIKGNEERRQAVLAAERARGLRDLRAEHLERLEAALAEVAA